ncbi:GNAT family N-acetyltransferase [Galbibacter sp. EGI 63066]|uniref:GNAT family N-acetyltransferase n=1 Tax=Galbibacter sp. EGI 63066 TaxID=2993559 RepID=UPI002248CE2C|nr:GNAT family N-acetyltransferase [Galbibacter sp. EGI 63066]MCX2679390.1 GNAT family N-acetyltransferase [Galbibacter sp. EGI 63066]
MLKCNLHPNKKHLDCIERWLIDEKDTTNQGFYCNWNIILQAFAEKRMSVITDNNAIGFVVYQMYDFMAVIDIIEIKPSEREKGFAKKLIKETLRFFKSKGVLVVQLFCSPENSEPFWKKNWLFEFS